MRILHVIKRRNLRDSLVFQTVKRVMSYDYDKDDQRDDAPPGCVPNGVDELVQRKRVLAPKKATPTRVDPPLTSLYAHCDACGHNDDMHAPDCAAMLELEAWAQEDAKSRAKSRPVAGKHPLSKSQIFCDDNIDDPMEDSDHESAESCGHDNCMEMPKQPSLDVFFGFYDLTQQTQIALCRTHANHLAALLRASSLDVSTTKVRGAKKVKITE